MSPGERPLFGDVLAQARHAWIAEMARRVAQHGYRDYRRSDALSVRLLERGPISLGDFTKRSGTSRQLARKIVDGLVRRGYGEVVVDPIDTRRRIVQLTEDGHDYARNVITALREMNEMVNGHFDTSRVNVATDVLIDIVKEFTRGQSAR